MTVDAPNVTCSVIKPAEANGRGFIIRLNETTGKETTATVSLPMLPAIESRQRNIAGRKRPARAYRVKGNTFQVTLPKFGVKTIPRHLCRQSRQCDRPQRQSRRRHAGGI